MTEVSPAAAGLIKTPVVRCAHDAMVATDTLLPHPKNPNKHPPKQIEMFISIIGYTGWRRCVTVSKRSGFVTKGHGALQAAIAAGWSEVPVDYQDYDDESQEISDIVADNTLQRMSELDNVKLKEVMVELNTGSFNMELTGFEIGKLEKLLAPTEKPRLNIEGAANHHETVVADKDGEIDDDGDSVSDVGSDIGSDDGDQETKSPSAHVRMVQLFLTSETQAEFMQIVEFFQKDLEIDNVTDTVMEILRCAYKAHSDDLEGQE